jgi:hypothetical protein
MFLNADFQDIRYRYKRKRVKGVEMEHSPRQEVINITYFECFLITSFYSSQLDLRKISTMEFTAEVSGF